MNIAMRELLQEIDQIEAEMRSLEGRLTRIRVRLHGGRRDMTDAGQSPREALAGHLVGDHSACCGGHHG